MGQYYRAFNIDKGEFLSPMDFDFGNKLMESCCVGNRFVDALTTLLTTAWRGDRVVFCGDYAYDEVDRIRGRTAKAGFLFKDEEGA